MKAIVVALISCCALMICNVSSGQRYDAVVHPGKSIQSAIEAAPSNVTIFGDAAHVMPPFAGEGVNMAMVDALELSENLTSADYNTIQDAIASYEMKMRQRATKLAQASLDNGNRMHSKSALATMLEFFYGHSIEAHNML